MKLHLVHMIKSSLFLILIFIFIYLWLCWVFVSVRGLSLVAASGATLHHGARASHCCGLSCCGAQPPDAQAQQLLTGPVALRHVVSSQTRARTRVPCIGRQILNHCATREAPKGNSYPSIATIRFQQSRVCQQSKKLLTRLFR